MRDDPGIKRDHVDWSQSRIIFLSPEFTPHQINAINFRDMAFDLYEVKLFENGTLSLTKVTPAAHSESIELVTKSRKIRELTSQVKNYTVDDLFRKGWESVRTLFDELDERITALDPNITARAKRSYVGYQLGQRNVVTIVPQKSRLILQLPRTRPDDVKDPEKRVKLVKNSMKYYNQHISWLPIENTEDISYGMLLVKQVYNRHFQPQS